MNTTTASRPARRPASARAHVRGSALLLAGRVLSLALNFAAQILTVRYLSKADYGALAFALAIAATGSSLQIFSLSGAIGRFTSMYHERGEYGRILGAILLSIGAVLGFGVSAVAAVHGFQGALTGALDTSPLAIGLLLIIVVLAPVEAMNELVLKLLAVFGGARMVFLRRHVVGPGLRLGAVAAVVLVHGDVRGLAFAYVFSGCLGVLLYSWLIVHLLRKQRILTRGALRRIQVPFREFLGFSVPLLSTDLLFFARTTLLVILVDHFHGGEGVAEFRAVSPVTRLNLLVQINFAYLFLPMATRLLARGARDGMETMYWKSVGWVATLTFPIFAATCLMAEPVSVLLFGERYASSGAVLAILSIGSYVHGMHAFDTDLLKVLGRVRYIVVGDAIAFFVALGVGVFALPRLGAAGAAITSTTALVVNRFLARLFLRSIGGIGFPRATAGRIYGGVVGCSAILYALYKWIEVPVAVGLAAIGVLTLALVRINRDLLEIGETFPELRRTPLARFFPPRTSADPHETV